MLGEDEETGNGIEIGDEVSVDRIEKNVEEFMDVQLQQQEQSLLMMAEQSENISENDVYMVSSVDEVSSSEFGSLHKVKIIIEGRFPEQDNMSQLTGELESFEQEQDLFVSQDGRYVFQQPTDLEGMSACRDNRKRTKLSRSWKTKVVNRYTPKFQCQLHFERNAHARQEKYQLKRAKISLENETFKVKTILTKRVLSRIKSGGGNNERRLA